jgi:hypothetical protein
MNTITATSTATRIGTESVLRRKARSFIAEVRRALEFMGNAYAHGVPPL